VRLVPPEAATGLTEQDVFKNKTIIPPNSEIEIVLFSLRDFDLADEKAYRETETLKIFIFGAFTYRDAFHRTQTTDFRFEAVGDVWASRGRLQPTEDGNVAS